MAQPLAASTTASSAADTSSGADSGANGAGAELQDSGATFDEVTGADASTVAILDAKIEDAADGGVSADGTVGDSSPVACPVGQICVASFPFSHSGDSATLKTSAFNSYSCKTGADESGPEQVFAVQVPSAGFLSAAVYDGAAVDVDVHILSALDASKCLDRGDNHARADVNAGLWYVVVDTFVSGGKAQSGVFKVDIGFTAPSMGPCQLQAGVMKRVNDGGKWLAMPATGPIVMEAHLVTAEEPPPYPATATDELTDHYALSQQKTGFMLYRSQVWAPLEGGSFYGAGILSPKTFPVVEEAWYVNMYWTKESRPPPGTRMILRLPDSSRAVVVSAGHETGPGNLAHIGGTAEESHFHLGTGHKSVMLLGIAVDQSLPFGPRSCQ
ncbi:MAG: hypothetical protein EXR77_15090 [Myxococcales bacterium]|nr:hypothetical protein [Myxococcales bacterium]